MKNNQEIKSEMRKNILAKRNNLDMEYCDRIGEVLLERLISGEYLKNINTVFIYVSTGKEVSTLPTIEYMLNNSIQVCVPKVTGCGNMKAVEIKSLSNLGIGKFGIYEPVDNIVQMSIPIPTLAIIPGLAFDKEGYRIGYGGGYYDRYFSNFNNLEEVYKLGVCYDFQLVDEVPIDQYDIKMDEVLMVDFLNKNNI